MVSNLFSPHTFQIRNNGNILYKNKNIFFPNWYENNIIYVKKLLNPEGYLVSYSEFLSSYQIPIPPREYAIVMYVNPQGVLMLFRSSLQRRALLTPPFLYWRPLWGISVLCPRIKKQKHLISIPERHCHCALRNSLLETICACY